MDKTGLEEKLLDLQSNMLNFAISLTMDASSAEDLLQETTLKVLDNQEKFTRYVNFKGWVLTIMKNIFINNYRKEHRNQTIIDNSEDLYHLNLTHEERSENVESTYSTGEISKLIESFSNEFRIPFMMHIQGYKYEEISEHLRLPMGTIKSRIFLTRKRLQEQLKDYRS
jgi:RNA polymerase sigma-70 factor (ECF subfamily)